MPGAGRGRLYFVQRSKYYDTHDESGNLTRDISDEEWREEQRALFDPDRIGAKSVAMIFHDQDMLDDGTAKKELHVHAVINLEDSKSQSAMQKILNISRPKNCACIQGKSKNYGKRKTGAYQYLIHITEDALKAHKHIYDVSDIEVMTGLGPNGDRLPFDIQAALSGLADSVEEQADLDDARNILARDVATGEKTLDEVRTIYYTDSLEVGFDATAWKQQRAGYIQDEQEWFDSLARWYGHHPRCLTTTYIQAPGDFGKTRLARALAESVADSRGVHTVATKGEGKTFDMAGNYRGERATIINELSGSAFSPDEFCNNFDPINAGMANSRHKDKPWFPDYCFITSAVHFEKFIWSMYEPYAKELLPVGAKQLTKDSEWQAHYESRADIADKIRQIRRRIAVGIEIRDLSASIVPGCGGAGAVRTAMIYARDNSSNPPHCFKTSEGFESASNGEPDRFQLVSLVPYRSAEDLPAVVEAFHVAVMRYYEINPEYDITPYNVVKPTPEIFGI